MARLALIALVIVVARKYVGPYLPALPYGKIFGGLFLLVALVLPVISEVFIPQQSRYLLDLASSILTYIMLGWGLNIVVGFAGLLDLGYVAFYAVGAYSFALLAHYFGLSFWICLPLAGTARRDLGHDPRLPGAAAARRLPRASSPSPSARSSGSC